MKNYHFLIPVAMGILFLASLSGCSAPKETVHAGAETINAGEETVHAGAETINAGAETVHASSAPSDASIQLPSNMVDERFELLSLVFRLAGREEYNDVETEYQKLLVSEFDGYREHGAVKYAAQLPLGYDAVFKFAVHIQKDGEPFVFIDNIDSLVEDGRWTRQSAAEFLELLNDFYAETGFSAFYQSQTDFYKDETQRFIDSTYSSIDLAWFDTYVDPDNLRCVYSPSSVRNNYGATVNGTVVYCAVSGNGSAIVHEYCHSFANPIAHKWYEENPEFQKWCDDTVDPAKLPSYNSGQIIAGEYVTRAYNTLYYAEHGYALAPLFYVEKGNGFPYIEEVYALITPYEKPEMGRDKIESILGVQYEMGAEQSFSIGNRELCWRFLSLSEPLPYVFQQTEVGNVFGSSTGDVLYVEDSGAEYPYLLIDLGETSFQGKDGYRKYSRIPME